MSALESLKLTTAKKPTHIPNSPCLLMGTFNLLPELGFGRPQFFQNHQISPLFLFVFL